MAHDLVKSRRFQGSSVDEVRMNTSSSPFPPFLKGVSRALGGIAILAALAVGLVLSSVGPLQAADAPDYPENGTGAVATFTAEDPEGESIVWSLAGDDDMGLFSIEDGVLRFKSAPDFEAPADAGGNNMYVVTVQASDGGDDTTATEVVTIEVTNVEEPGTVTMSTLQPQVGVAITATLD